ncbi:MAG: hypothetical protein V7K86_13690, partial [Nostoc sp.]|uniref:hypothetical protein n=1 Tax=Nostoc sp. TaxID=1180 RepID=UPI002FF581D0
MIILTGIITNKYLSLASIYKQNNMVNNFLVQHISKGTGRFFASASIAISILSTIGLSSSRVWADYVYTNNIPSLAQTDIQAINKQGASIDNVVFPLNGGFGIVYGTYGYYTSFLPQELLNDLSTINKQKLTINSIVFTPSGQWLVIYGKNGFYRSTNFPQDVTNALLQINKQNFTINSVAFTPYGGWVIIYGGNGSYQSQSNIPQALSNKIVDINKAKQTIKYITFTNNGEWIIIYDQGNSRGNAAFWSKNFPQQVITAINKIYADSGQITTIAFTPEVLNVKKNPIKIAQNMVLLGEGLKYISLIM